MAPRLKVESGLGRVNLQPAASPVNTFARGGEGEQLSQLADALGQVAPDVKALGQVLTQRKNEKDKAGGEQLARDLFESGKSYREAIASGKITPDQSPWFRQGAEEQFGKLAANRFDSDLSLAFSQSEHADSYDAKDFDAFASTYMKTWAAENLPDDRTQAFNTGFANVDQYIAGQRDQFAKRAGENLVKYNRDQFGASVFADLRRLTASHASMDDMAKQVQSSLDLQVASGLNPRVANDIAAESVIRMAEVTKNPAFMDLLKSIKAGPTTLYDRPAIGAAVLKAEQDIYDRRAQEDRAEAQRRNEANRTATNSVMSAAIAAINKNPATANLDPFVAQLRQLDNPDSTVAALANLKRTLAGEKFAGDQGLANELLAHVTTVTDPHDPNYVSRLTAANALNARRINQTDFNNILSYIERRDREDTGEGGKIVRDPNFEAFRTLLKAQFGNELTMPAEKALGMFRAVAEFTNEWVKYREGEGAGKGDKESIAFLTGLIEQKRQRFGGQFVDIRNSFTQGIPQAQVGEEPAWKRGPVTQITKDDWRGIATAVTRGAGAIDSLSDDQIKKIIAAGGTPETLSEFIQVQLQFNGIATSEPSAKPRGAGGTF